VKVYSVLNIRYQQELKSLLVKISVVSGRLLIFLGYDSNKEVDYNFDFRAGLFDLHELLIQARNHGEVGAFRG